MELSIPRRTRPLLERLADARGAPSNRALAQRLIRRLEAEAAAQPGTRLTARCAAGVAEAAAPLGRLLAERIGERFVITSDPGRLPERFDVAAA